MSVSQQNATFHITNTQLNTSSPVKIVSVPVGSVTLNPSPMGIPVTIIQNQSAQDVYIGPSNVATSGDNTGILLKGNQTPPTSFVLTFCGETYAISGSSTPSITVAQIY